MERSVKNTMFTLSRLAVCASARIFVCTLIPKTPSKESVMGKRPWKSGPKNKGYLKDCNKSVQGNQKHRQASRYPQKEPNGGKDSGNS
jgi:hypothetical protein